MNGSRLAAGATGVACFALGILTLAGPSVPDEHWGARGAWVNGLGLVAFAAMAVALELLPPLLELRRLGRIGRRIAQAGLVLMVVESVASQVHGGNTIGGVFMIGLLASLVGLLLVAVDGVVRRRWLAALPFAALLVGIGAGDRGGFLVLGLTWVAFAVAAPGMTRPRTSAPAAAEGLVGR